MGQEWNWLGSYHEGRNFIVVALDNRIVSSHASADALKDACAHCCKDNLGSRQQRALRDIFARVKETNLCYQHEPVVALKTPHDDGSGICAQAHGDPAQSQQGDGGADQAAAIVFVEVDFGHDKKVFVVALRLAVIGLATAQVRAVVDDELAKR